MRGRFALAALLLAGAAPAHAGLDLAEAQVTHLDNGLTVIVLEDHSLPVVSVQALYKSGSRDEEPGKTGLAHFLEHLAFRATENYPDGSATDAIYDAGGEWHGYTWIDQTTYFSTMPKDGLGLLLDIEADRMARIAIDPAAMEAEAGAVITEMHGYENDPSSVLFDAVAGVALQAHPYRIPTIGYEADVAALTADDAQEFYRAHYAPDNAVLVVAGDIDRAKALEAVRAHFAAVPRGPGVTRSKAVEPPQRGERRLRLSGPVDRHFLELAYPAPAASSPDFAGFLLLQQLASGGSGVNFRQNDWGAPVEEGSALGGAADDLTTWFIPTAEPYLFVISASTADNEAALENAIEQRLGSLRDAPVSAAALAEARAKVREQLAFDLETTEDAAHQLAFFEGLGALDALLGLDDALARVTPKDIQRLAQAYLGPDQRTIGWYVPGERADAARPGMGDPAFSPDRPGAPSEGAPAAAPQLRKLARGLPAIVQQSPLSPTVTVQVALSAPDAAEGEAIVRSGLASELPRLVAETRAALDAAGPAPEEVASQDPYARMEQLIAQRIGQRGQAPRPVAVVVSGDVSADAAFAALAGGFGTVAPAAAPKPEKKAKALETIRETIGLQLSQAALGYVVAAPPPGTRQGLAMRMMLYVLSHSYGGRLGNDAIKHRGLTYYIDSAYSGDAAGGWITLASGVDPEKMDPMEAALRSQLARLASEPPSAAELEAARNAILGRDLSAAQSNDELAGKLARTFAESGKLPDHAALAAALAKVTPADLAAAARALARGTIIRVDVGADR